MLAKDLEQAVAGLPLYVARMPDEIEVLRDDVAHQLEKALTIKRKPEGVYVQASTLGSLEALLEFLKQQKIPVLFMEILASLLSEGFRYFKICTCILKCVLFFRFQM